MAQKFAGYKAWLAMMKERNPQVQEDGFFFLQKNAAAYIDELLADFSTEKDHCLQCWLLELIRNAKSSRALPMLVKMLNCDDERFRFWAAEGLHKLNTKQSQKVLRDARLWPLKPPKETK